MTTPSNSSVASPRRAATGGASWRPTTRSCGCWARTCMMSVPSLTMSSGSSHLLASSVNDSGAPRTSTPMTMASNDTPSSSSSSRVPATWPNWRHRWSVTLRRYSVWPMVARTDVGSRNVRRWATKAWQWRTPKGFRAASLTSKTRIPSASGNSTVAPPALPALARAASSSLAMAWRSRGIAAMCCSRYRISRRSAAVHALAGRPLLDTLFSRPLFTARQLATAPSGPAR
mmetsp:Transcript_43729/g.135045  ORF Transcript_43729/g.135045 Transcript_43729/m.135045 type:complete len:230 (+) Transcript_43729:1691-2380(+)